jgi:tRNA acetyltransferase TAN1
MINFNLIVSTFRYREPQAQDELIEILDNLGDPDPKSYLTTISGILLARTNFDPFTVVEQIFHLLHNEPWRIRYILRLLPIEIVVCTEPIIIMHTAKQLSSKIRALDTFRITVERRHNSIRSLDIINFIASVIDRKVDLRNPDWIILAEVVGNLTGLSILKPYHIFSSVTEKRRLDTTS